MAVYQRHRAVDHYRFEYFVYNCVHGRGIYCNSRCCYCEPYRECQLFSEWYDPIEPRKCECCGKDDDAFDHCAMNPHVVPFDKDVCVTYCKIRNCTYQYRSEGHEPLVQIWLKDTILYETQYVCEPDCKIKLKHCCSVEAPLAK